MDLDELIISMYVHVDDQLKAIRQRLHVARFRQRGPAPRLSDAEVLTMECVGEFLGLDCDKHAFAYFRRHYPHFFPALARVHRTTFARQAANLWHVKELLWRRLAGEVAPADDRLHIAPGSMPVPVCRFARASFARASFCRNFRGAARYGKDHADRQTFYGFRLHARLTWPGLIGELSLTPANQSEPSVLPHLAGSAPAGCAVLGDRNYCSPGLRARLAADGQALLTRLAADGQRLLTRLAADGQRLLTPPARRAKDDPPECRGRRWPLGDLRYLIDTVFGQLTDRFHVKRLWARDLWHLTGRVYRKVLAHTLALIVNAGRGNPPLQFDLLLQA